MSMGDSNTPVSYWLSLPIIDLRDWLEVMNDYYRRQAEAIKKHSRKR